MMTALCNDKEFGSKDSLLIPCNFFLRPYRYPMKQFIVDCTRRPIPSLEIIPEALTTTVSPVEKKPLGSIVSETSNDSNVLTSIASSKWSMDLGKSDKSPKPAASRLTGNIEVLKTVSVDPLTGITNDPDVTALLFTLSKSMKKLELDVEVRAKFLGDQQQKDIEERFKQFKDLLVVHYPAVIKKSQNTSRKSQEFPKERNILMRSLSVLRRWLRRKRPVSSTVST